MAPQPSPTKQGTQPQPSNIPPIPGGNNDVAFPSTPVRNIIQTPRRHTRRSDQKIEVQTLPGTRWDELEIERRRETQRGRELPSDTTGTSSLERLSLREKSVQVSNNRTATTKVPDWTTGRRQTQTPAHQSGPSSIGSAEDTPIQVFAAASSSVRRHRPNRSQPHKHEAADTRPNNEPPPLIADHFGGGDFLPNMARRPGRNQVDYVAELKETIHESLSKLSDIQEKLTPLGQQIVVLEEELKAKESDNGKLKSIPEISLDTY